jgi:cell division protein FtsQ
MSQTIRRSGKGVGRAAASRAAARRKATESSALDRLLAALPVTPERLHQVFLVLIFAALAMLAWAVASMAGVPAMASAHLATAAADAGFEVRHVEVRGVSRMDELDVYERVLGERDRAMPLLDLAGLRAELLRLPWVEDARVSRQLPDTLVVDIVERTPHAVLRKGNRYVLIDASGNELEPVAGEQARRMLVLAGKGAARKVPELERLLETAPALKPQVREAEWVGERRWNLTFKSGQVLALPEGADAASSALLAFARLDGVNRLIGGKVATFDMRIADRMYLRVPGHARELAERRAEQAAAKAAARKE